MVTDGNGKPMRAEQNITVNEIVAHIKNTTAFRFRLTRSGGRGGAVYSYHCSQGAAHEE